jgi:hypothetical protein
VFVAAEHAQAVRAIADLDDLVRQAVELSA